MIVNIYEKDIIEKKFNEFLNIVIFKNLENKKIALNASPMQNYFCNFSNAIYINFHFFSSFYLNKYEKEAPIEDTITTINFNSIKSIENNLFLIHNSFCMNNIPLAMRCIRNIYENIVQLIFLNTNYKNDEFNTFKNYLFQSSELIFDLDAMYKDDKNTIQDQLNNGTKILNNYIFNYNRELYYLWTFPFIQKKKISHESFFWQLQYSKKKNITKQLEYIINNSPYDLTIKQATKHLKIYKKVCKEIKKSKKINTEITPIKFNDIINEINFKEFSKLYRFTSQFEHPSLIEYFYDIKSPAKKELFFENENIYNNYQEINEKQVYITLNDLTNILNRLVQSNPIIDNQVKNKFKTYTQYLFKREELPNPYLNLNIEYTEVQYESMLENNDNKFVKIFNSKNTIDKTKFNNYFCNYQDNFIVTNDLYFDIKKIYNIDNESSKYALKYMNIFKSLWNAIENPSIDCCSKKEKINQDNFSKFIFIRKNTDKKEVCNYLIPLLFKLFQDFYNVCNSMLSFNFEMAHSESRKLYEDAINNIYIAIKELEQEHNPTEDISEYENYLNHCNENSIYYFKVLNPKINIYYNKKIKSKWKNNAQSQNQMKTYIEKKGISIEFFENQKGISNFYIHNSILLNYRNPDIYEQCLLLNNCALLLLNSLKGFDLCIDYKNQSYESINSFLSSILIEDLKKIIKLYKKPIY